MNEETKGRQRTEYLSDYVVFDLETTGTSCRQDKIVEISAVKVRHNRIEEEMSSLVNPGCNIPYYATQINGITDDMVACAPYIEEVLPVFLSFVGDLPLVGHNIHAFDMKFIYRDCDACLGKVPANDYVDTLKMARICLPELPHHKLSDLAGYYGISTKGAHRALIDCRINQAVYEKLGELLRESSRSVRKCPDCGGLLVKRSGKYGPFFGCSAYPACKHTEKI